LAGFGISTSERQISTQRLQPLHRSELKLTARLGVGGFGIIKTRSG
jgi:hypothetical protein